MAKTAIITAAEPDASLIDYELPSYRINLSKALTWYNIEKDYKDSHKYLIDWAKKNNKALLPAIETTSSYISPTIGWLARLLLRGARLEEKDMNTFLEVLQALKPKVVVKQSTRPSIQVSIAEKAKAYLGELEGVLDEIVKLGGDGFTIKAFLHSNEIPAVYLPYIDTWAKEKLAYFEQVSTSKDAQVKEAYSHYKKRNYVSILNFLREIRDGVNAYGQVKKANRKPRARKAIPPGVQVKNLKYRSEDPEFAIKSIPPTEVVGAQQLWVFNCKYRKLGVYRTDSATGLQVKGTTIQNYIPEMSMQKTIRKPDVVLKEVMTAGKVALRKVLEKVNGKEFPMNGRINEECILLRVIK